jgi:transcriptional regulator with XRE-family HTH domain
MSRAKSPLSGLRPGLSQRQLAKLVGTPASVICRLEDADYEGHSLAMLNRIATALNRRVEIHFVPAERRYGQHDSQIENVILTF